MKRWKNISPSLMLRLISLKEQNKKGRHEILNAALILNQRINQVNLIFLRG